MQLKCHDVETSLLEGVMCRGDRRVGEAIELAWRRGARFDGWAEQFQPELWWQALADAGIDVEKTLHLPCPAHAAAALGSHRHSPRPRRIWSASIAWRRSMAGKWIAVSGYVQQVRVATE